VQSPENERDLVFDKSILHPKLCLQCLTGKEERVEKGGLRWKVGWEIEVNPWNERFKEERVRRTRGGAIIFIRGW